MQLSKRAWDIERAAAWLRRHMGGARGEQSAPPLDDAVVAAAAEAQAAVEVKMNLNAVQEDEDEEIDIAGWPALVAPFYD